MDDRAILVAVADAGTFAGAARRLGLSRSTVLRRVDALEARLDRVFVQRAGRQIALSEAGLRYVEQVRPLLRELDRVDDELRQRDEALTGTLRVWLPVLGTSTGVAGALADFRRAHPGVRLEIELADNATLSVGAFDVALQVGLRRNPSFRARTLYRERLVLVASPDYIAARGVPTLETLAEHDAVLTVDADGRGRTWRFPDGARVTPPPAAITVNAVGFAHELALAGQGIARIPRTLATPDIARGVLVQVLDDLWVEEPVSFVFPGTPGPVARVFLDETAAWFRERLPG